MKSELTAAAGSSPGVGLCRLLWRITDQFTCDLVITVVSSEECLAQPEEETGII